MNFVHVRDEIFWEARNTQIMTLKFSSYYGNTLLECLRSYDHAFLEYTHKNDNIFWRIYNLAGIVLFFLKCFPCCLLLPTLCMGNVFY